METQPTIPDPTSWHFQGTWCSPKWPKVHLNPVPGLVLPKAEDQDLERHCAVLPPCPSSYPWPPKVFQRSGGCLQRGWLCSKYPSGMNHTEHRRSADPLVTKF
ncbi:unnamed protein product [Rangifer tarandus platyrhynchus]|uniref:Uncharacterized protein n=2 Tax=Rangifer tarandus platyrhynchus TaxID=3082113 RepID=A0ABN8XYA2_RANTA|nr:unnamed protein product [Rangifer tarandus platyrhynchus]